MSSGRPTSISSARIADLLAGIVEKGRTQLEAEAQVEALKALDEARTELIALVTHELRTPLAVVRAYTDLLSEEPPLVGRESRDMIRRRTREEWHNRAIDQIERLDRLVDSILASVRPLDERPSDVVPVDVGALLEEVIVGLRPLLRNHRLVVSGGLRRFALADPPRLRQVVEHLVENAVKYAPPGTTITVDTALVEGMVRVGVSDEGPGIPAEWRERVFEPYARRETHTARGSGIGLFAAKRAIRVDGRPSLVRARRSGRRSLRHRPAGRGRGLSRGDPRPMPTTRPLRILVVDDDPAMVGAITALVGTEGHQVITAYDGLTAVKRFREEAPDLVLLDLAMPGPDGFNVTGQIRASGNVPILVVSGESGEAAKVKALEIGADDYLTKPFGKAELLARISAIMRRADAASVSAGGPGLAVRSRRAR